MPLPQDCRHGTSSQCKAVWDKLKTETKERRKGEENFSFTVKKGGLGTLTSHCQNRGKKGWKDLSPLLQSNISDLAVKDNRMTGQSSTILWSAGLNGGISRVMFAFLLLHRKILQSRIQCYSLLSTDIISRYLWIGLEIESSEPSKPRVPTVCPKAAIHVKG